MADPIIDRDIDDDPIQRAVINAEISELRGRFHVTITPKRKSPRNASPEQHGYYRAVVLPLARGWLNETQGGIADDNGEPREFTEEETHVWLKNYLLGVDVVDKRTGEVTGRVFPSHGNLSTVQLFRFTEDVVTELTRFGIRVPPPDKNWREAKARAMQEAMNCEVSEVWA